MNLIFKIIKKSNTLIERGRRNVPRFDAVYKKPRRSVECSGKSRGILTNYARCLELVGLDYNCDPLRLDEEQVLDYLHHLKSFRKTPSDSFFKHTVYGLRYLLKVIKTGPKIGLEREINFI